ncbi:hypothetical protein F2Q68_00016152 [Brassica cretica]|uniref:Uncharacterized protein n=1 Tax=Brassica cretica TaxID=69181 RepID=A0A8S9HG01_BRACR|nr:hypothetical protein F2Q68_00016152 [Brassica cretica]
MPSSTRSNKETQLLFSPDPASLERSIRKEAHSSSIDNNTCSSLDFDQPPSTQTLVPSTDTRSPPSTGTRSPPSTEDTHLPSTDIVHPTSQTSIDTEPRDMVATLILVRDDNSDLHDQDGHLRNAAGQRIYAQGAAIPESDANATGTTLPIDEAARPKTYMPNNTRSDKETQLLFSPDPASLERSIRKEARSSSIDNNTCSSLDFVQPPSTQTLVPSTDTRSPPSTEDTHLPSTDIVHPTSIHTPSQTPIDTEPRDMVATLILVRDDNGDLHDQDGLLRNAAGQRIDAQGLQSLNPASLERSIRKEAHSSSIDNNTCSSLDFDQPPSTQTLVPSTDTRSPPSTGTRSPPSTEDTHLPSTDIVHPTSQTSIDTEPRDMVATLILVRDDNSDLHDQDGHLRNAAVVKEEKLQEGDFEVESLMSFGGSHWFRSTPDFEHRSTSANPNRSTGSPEHRPMTPTESTASCKAVRILTHEEFAAKHPHPPRSELHWWNWIPRFWKPGWKHKFLWK